MAIMHPRIFPHDLLRGGMRAGEAAVFAALQNGLSDDWQVFYDRSIPGSRRRLDFVAADPVRGIIAIEVKGGLVHAARGWFRQRIRPSGQRKTIDPFAQVRFGAEALCTAAGVAVGRLPLHMAIWFPVMSRSAFPWRRSSAHLLTRESLGAAELRSTFDGVLSTPTTAEQRVAIVKVIASLRALRVRPSS